MVLSLAVLIQEQVQGVFHSETLFPKMGCVLEGMTAPQLPEQGLSAPLTSGVYRPAAP